MIGTRIPAFGRDVMRPVLLGLMLGTAWPLQSSAQPVPMLQAVVPPIVWTRADRAGQPMSARTTVDVAGPSRPAPPAPEASSVIASRPAAGLLEAPAPGTLSQPQASLAFATEIETPDAVLARAEAAYHAKDDVEALRGFTSLTQREPSLAARAWFRIGNVHQRRGDVGAAIDAYRRTAALSGPSSATPGAQPLDVQRKALLNLASLALDASGDALSQLNPDGIDPRSAGAAAPLPAPAHQATPTPGGRAPTASTPMSAAPAVAGEADDGPRFARSALERHEAAAERLRQLQRQPARGSRGRGVVQNTGPVEAARAGDAALPPVEYLQGGPAARRRAGDPVERR